MGSKTAGLAQSVERQALNLMVEGSSPSFGGFLISWGDAQELFGKHCSGTISLLITADSYRIPIRVSQNCVLLVFKMTFWGFLKKDTVPYRIPK